MSDKLQTARFFAAPELAARSLFRKVRIGLDLARKRFTVDVGHLVIENREMKRVLVAVRAAHQVQRLTSRSASGVAKIPMIELLAKDEAIGRIVINVKEA